MARRDFSVNLSIKSYYAFNGNNDIKRDDVALSVNCCGFQAGLSSTSENIRIRCDYYLIYLFDGDFCAKIDGKNHRMRPGDFICIPPNTPYCYTSTEKSRIKYFWVHFTGSEVENVLKKSGIKPLSSLHASNIPFIFGLYEELFTEFRIRRESFDYRTEIILRNILLHLTAESTARFSTKGNALDGSIEYIHTHLQEKISISALAKSEFMSESYYRKIFKRLIGLSPSEYIIKQRINLSLYLLSDGIRSIESVAESVGIADRLYFQRLFKKHTGYTPAKYRSMFNKRGK